MKKLCGMVFALVLMLSLAHCSSEAPSGSSAGSAAPSTGADASEAPATKGRIGMTCMDLTNPFFKLIALVMRMATAWTMTLK